MRFIRFDGHDQVMIAFDRPQAHIMHIEAIDPMRAAAATSELYHWSPLKSALVTQKYTPMVAAAASMVGERDAWKVITTVEAFEAGTMRGLIKLDPFYKDTLLTLCANQKRKVYPNIMRKKCMRLARRLREERL